MHTWNRSRNIRTAAFRNRELLSSHKMQNCTTGLRWACGVNGSVYWDYSHAQEREGNIRIIKEKEKVRNQGIETQGGLYGEKSSVRWRE